MSNSGERNIQDQKCHKLDTPDFLAFNDSASEFNPVNSSSPRKNWRSVNRNQKKWSRHRFSGNRNNSYDNHSRSFGDSSSPDNYNKSFGLYDSFSSKRIENLNNSIGSSHHESPNRNSSCNSSRNDSYKNTTDGFDISLYLHPSFMENPWAKLEKKYED